MNTKGNWLIILGFVLLILGGLIGIFADSTAGHSVSILGLIFIVINLDTRIEQLEKTARAVQMSRGVRDE